MPRRPLWTILLVFSLLLPLVSFGPAPATAAPLALATPTVSPSPTPTSSPLTVGIGPSGGTLALPGEGHLLVPAGALASPSQFWVSAVELRLTPGLLRYHPLDEAVTISATAAGTAVSRLAAPATVQISLANGAFPAPLLQQPALRILNGQDWQLMPAVYDTATQTIAAPVSTLPVTLAVVDGARPPSDPGWDPVDPAAVQATDGSWRLAYDDNRANLFVRRSLGSQDPVYWPSPTTVDTGSDMPSLVRLGSTLALFYRKSDGTVKQV